MPKVLPSSDRDTDPEPDDDLDVLATTHTPRFATESADEANGSQTYVHDTEVPGALTECSTVATMRNRAVKVGIAGVLVVSAAAVASSNAVVRASPVGARSSVCTTVPGATGGDIAVVNITNTNATGQGWGALRSSTATPVHQRPPTSQYSSVNFAASTPPNPNLAFVTIGPDARFCYDSGPASSNVILDLVATLPATTTNAQDPTRILDTRNTSPVGARSSVCTTVPGATGGDIAVVNITNTNATGQGWGALRSSTATPVHQRPPTSQYSSVNFAASTPPNPNLAFVTIGPDARFCYDSGPASSNVILDLVATLPATTTNAQDPTRILDTRPDPEVGNIVVPTLCGWDLEQRPSAMAVNCTSSRFLRDVVWQSWGPGTAAGTGTYVINLNNCFPPDAGCQVVDSVEIRLYDVRRIRCGDADPDFYFSALQLRPRGSQDRYETWDIGEFVSC